MKIAAFYENIAEGAKKEGISLREALCRLKAAGMEKVYMCRRSLAEGGSELTDLLAELGLTIEGLFDFFDFGHHPEDTGYEDLIDRASEVHADNVLIVPGMITKEDEMCRMQMMNHMKTCLSRAVAYGKEKNVAVSMEDFDGMDAPYCTIAGLNWFMTEVEGLACSFDTGNFILYHEDELEAFRLFADRICTVHLKDRSAVCINEGDIPCVCADDQKMYPSPVGFGDIRIREILEQLKQRGYQGSVIVELFNYSDMLEGIRSSVQWVKENIQ